MKNTYRSIFRWGNLNHEEILSENLKRVLSEEFDLTEADFKPVSVPGEEEVVLSVPSQLSPRIQQKISEIVGRSNLSTSDYDRASHSYGKFYGELIKLRKKEISTPPDAVVHPTCTEDIEEIIAICHRERVPVTPMAGKSSVTRALETEKKGISLDLSKHLNKVLKLNKANQTVTVQAGIFGPELEKYLNENGFTCGHFPQSFEFSTAGGWVAAKGAGQCSTGYGKIEDLVVSLKVVTPAGTFENKAYPAVAQGWDLFPLFIGSEGTLGVITEVTLKVFPHLPKSTAYGSFIFKNFESAVACMQQSLQAGIGKPHLFRISDPEETHNAFRMKGFNGSKSDKALQFLGYKPEERCLMFLTVEGSAAYSRSVKSSIKKLAKKNGGFSLGSKPVKKWLEQRFHSAYLRDPLMDIGIRTDTIETSANWDILVPLWKAVRSYIKSQHQTTCMVHISHAYSNGANLYFTFLSKMKGQEEEKDFLHFHKGLVGTIIDNGGSLSHHHGAGRLMAPYMQTQLGKCGMDVMKAIKQHLDPNNIMNPGALGL